jgi:N-methylhydantoinase A
VLLLGVDTGGTFTDFVLFDGSSLRVHKVLSTPDAPERAILQGIAEVGLTSEQFRQLNIVHGSTVATNAALEGKGVTTAFITNYGLKDILTIGRQARAELYNLQPQAQPVPVPEAYCLETGGRLGANGEVVEPLTEEELAELRSRLEALQPRAVAINLLFSFLDERFEKAIEAIIPQGIFISRSSNILPEYKEYERGITTWLNAWVGPLVEGYLQRLQQGVGEAAVAVMQSSGNTIAAEQAGGQAVHMLLSGPAGGLAGARFVAAHAGREHLLTFDMGGTSTDVALIDGELQLTSEGHIGPWPVSVPMVDMHTIGAGGGSIAYVDQGGMLQVGPESAGAAPGPACYGNGGQQPTVTDANLVLGRLRADAFLGGEMLLDVAAAREAVGVVADMLGLSVEEAAAGIIRVANEHMARALRVISVQRGVDPREFSLVSFGGAGGLHVCALAEALGMHQAVVPVHAGVLSALGMLAAPRGRELSHTLRGLLQELGSELIEAEFAELSQRGVSALEREGVAAREIVSRYSLDLRYRGQSYTLNVLWQSELDEVIEAFHRAHQARYGHRLELPVELVNLRVGLQGPPAAIELLELRSGGETTEPPPRATLYGVSDEVEVYQRSSLIAAQQMAGPALITEQVSTSYLAPGWSATVDPVGNLMLDRRQ